LRKADGLKLKGKERKEMSQTTTTATTFLIALE
jgi:hypothetical protein